jgi:hypothetical protein
MSIKKDDHILTAVEIETFRISNSLPARAVTRPSTMTIPTEIIPLSTTQQLKANPRPNVSVDLNNVLDVTKRAYTEL